MIGAPCQETCSGFLLKTPLSTRTAVQAAAQEPCLELTLAGSTVELVAKAWTLFYLWPFQQEA